MFLDHSPDIIIHLAAIVGGLYKNMSDKVLMFEKNIMINYNIVHLSYKYKVKKLIACLSTCIFPNHIHHYPITENMLHQGEPHHSNDAYAFAKRFLHIHMKTYCEKYNVNFICISPTNIYGTNDNFNLKDGHVIPSLIHQCYLAKKENREFIIKGSGKPLRQFIYSKDLAYIILNIGTSEHKIDNIIASVSENEEISIKEIAEKISNIFDYHNCKFDTSFSDGQYKKTVSNSKLLELFPHTKFTPIEQGLTETIHWFVQNYHICRK
jgi:GDP-L-fucose synthase